MNFLLDFFKFFAPKISFGVIAQLSGYQAAAQPVVFSGTRQIDSLADNEYTDLSDAMDNSLTKFMLMDIDLVLTGSSNRAIGHPYIAFFNHRAGCCNGLDNVRQSDRTK